jgi:hypothetical protein
MRLNRLLYFGYYLKNLDSEKFKKFVDYLKVKSKASKFKIHIRVLKDSLRYNISILEYFQFQFYNKSSKEKIQWAGTGYMYEYQKVMNPPSSREVLDDKTKFYKAYLKYFKHHALDINDIREKPEFVKEMLAMPKVVLKESKGKCGLGTAFIETIDLDSSSLIELMEKEGYDLAETYITQHPELNRLSPSGVNTVRIFTQLNSRNEVELLGCRQRISVDSPIDNLAAGNLAAPIDEETGIINGPGIYSDITKAPEVLHPVTGVSIVGFQVPLWEECKQLAVDAALEHPENRSIGWDIVVTENGPGLIEGNHDWCKLVWQLPVYQGLKHLLDKHLVELNNSKYV